MAREIDLTKKLSPEDRQYLVNRDRWRDIAEADGHGDPRRAKREAEANRGSLTQVALPPTDPQAPAKTLAEVTGRTSDEEDSNYEEWSFDELKAELDDRKAEALEGGMSAEEAGRRYSKGGSQKDLVARLRADDEENQQ